MTRETLACCASTTVGRSGLPRSGKEKKMNLVRHLTFIATLACLALFATPSAAACTGAPVMTGSIGSQSATASGVEFIGSIQKHATQPQAWTVGSNFGSATIGFGAPSGVQILTGTSCFTALGESPPGTGDCPSTGWSASRLYSVLMPVTYDASAIPITRVMINGTKVFELYGVAAVGSISSTTQQFFSGVARIRQDTGSNSHLYFEGWNKVNEVFSWKSVPVRFTSPCGWDEGENDEEWDMETSNRIQLRDRKLRILERKTKAKGDGK